MSAQLATWMHHRAVQTVLKRMLQYGIRMEKYVAQLEGEPFDEGPWGFNFLSNNPAEFKSDLLKTRKFGMIWKWDRIRPKYDQLREGSTNGSIHIILNKIPGDTSIIHLDTVSIVEGCDANGKLIYTNNGSILFRHLDKDLTHGKYIQEGILQ